MTVAVLCKISVPPLTAWRVPLLTQLVPLIVRGLPTPASALMVPRLSRAAVLVLIEPGAAVNGDAGRDGQGVALARCPVMALLLLGLMVAVPVPPSVWVPLKSRALALLRLTVPPCSVRPAPATLTWALRPPPMFSVPARVTSCSVPLPLIVL